MAKSKGPTVLIGRASIFRDKVERVQGMITAVGAGQFEAARDRLSTLVKRHVGDVSDGDVIEFLARGEANTRAYLKL